MLTENNGAIVIQLNSPYTGRYPFEYVITKSISLLTRLVHPTHGLIRTGLEEYQLYEVARAVVVNDESASLLNNGEILTLTYSEFNRVFIKSPVRKVKEIENLVRLDISRQKREFNAIFTPDEDEDCIPKAENLPYISKHMAQHMRLKYYYETSPSCKRHKDVTIFSNFLPKYIPRSRDMCRTCAEEKIKEKCPWRTTTHWRTEPTVVRKVRWSKSKPEYELYDIGFGYLYPDQYKTSGKLPLPYNINFISKPRAIKLHLDYYFPDTLCPRGHIDLRNMHDDSCVCCLLEEKAIEAGRTFKGHTRSFYKPEEMAPKFKTPSRFTWAESDLFAVVPEKRVTVSEIRSILALTVSYIKTGRPPSIATFCDIIGYSVHDLKNHLQSKFQPGMTWKNFGSYWSIDHVVPVSFLRDHDLLYPKIVNHLENLEPLVNAANSSKHANAVRSRVEDFRERLLLPNNLDFKMGWDSDKRIVDRPYWLQAEPNLP